MSLSTQSSYQGSVRPDESTLSLLTRWCSAIAIAHGSSSIAATNLVQLASRGWPESSREIPLNAAAHYKRLALSFRHFESYLREATHELGAGVTLREVMTSSFQVIYTCEILSFHFENLASAADREAYWSGQLASSAHRRCVPHLPQSVTTFYAIDNLAQDAEYARSGLEHDFNVEYEEPLPPSLAVSQDTILDMTTPDLTEYHRSVQHEIDALMICLCSNLDDEAMQRKMRGIISMYRNLDEALSLETGIGSLDPILADGQ